MYYVIRTIVDGQCPMQSRFFNTGRKIEAIKKIILSLKKKCMMNENIRGKQFQPSVSKLT